MNTDGLLPWQIPSSQHLLEVLQKNGAAVDNSDAGTGKTFVACALVRELNLPTLVVSPKAVIPSWHRVAETLGTEVSVVNYELVRRGNTPYGTWVKSGNGRGRWFQWSDAIKFLIFDEVHRASGLNTQNAGLVFSGKRQKILTLALSATLGDSPMKLRALGYILGLHNGHDFYRWARSNGCGPGVWGGFEFKGSVPQKLAVMQRLHKQLFPMRGVRVRTGDIPDFPETQITPELYTIDNPELVNRIYNEMAEQLAALKERASYDKDKTNPLTEILRARQQIELLKVPIFVELAQDAIEQGMSVVLFVNFRQTLDALITKLGIKCVVHGGQTGERGAIERQRHIDTFQADEERIIGCISGAGGVGLSLHDLHGNYPRLVLISPGFSAEEFKQVIRRVHRTGAKSKSLQRVILCAGTIEANIYRSLLRKLNNMDSLQDGDLSPVSPVSESRLDTILSS